MTRALLTTVVVLLGAAAQADDAVTLAGLIRLGAERNPRLSAARLAWRASIEELPQARALPDPMVRFDWFGSSVETRVGPQKYRYSASQAFPWPGTLDAKERVAAAAARVKHAEYDRAVQDFIADLSVSYHELLYLRGAIAITGRNQDLLNHILEVTNANYAQGKAKLRDVLRTQGQQAQVGYDLVLLRELEAVQVARINALLDRPTDTEVGELGRPPLMFLDLPLDRLEAAALDGRQEIAIAERQRDQAAEGVDLAKLKNRPLFSLNAMRIETGEAVMPTADSSKDAWLLGVGVSIPLWLDRNESRVRQAELRRDAAAESTRAVANDTRAMVREVYFRLENARRLVQLYDQSLIPQARQAMEIAEQWNDGETADVSGFLETQSTWLNFNLARLRAVTDYQQYRARLERVVGGPLPAVIQGKGGDQ